MNEPVTPMLEKEREAREDGHSQEIGDFLEWLADEKGVVLARYDTTQDNCRNCGHPDVHNQRGAMVNTCSYSIDSEDCECEWADFGSADRLYPIPETRIKLLADYFGIDLAQSERERCALLDWVRSRNEAKP